MLLSLKQRIELSILFREACIIVAIHAEVFVQKFSREPNGENDRFEYDSTWKGSSEWANVFSTVASSGAECRSGSLAHH